MAITRAQQFKQMLAQGGCIGLQRGGKDMGKEKGDFGADLILTGSNSKDISLSSHGEISLKKIKTL